MTKINKVNCFILFLSALFSSPAFASGGAEREDFFVATSDGYRIFVRQITYAHPIADRGLLLLINGGRPGVLASWDVDEPAASTAELFARAGHTVYLMDARGFGRSDFTPEMKDGAEDGPVAVTSHEVVRDIAAVVADIRRRHPNDARLAAMGWATGSQWLGHYASLYPETISHMIYYQGAYGGDPGGWTFQSLASRDDPATLDREEYPAFRCSTASQVVGRLGEETDDQSFLDRYIELAMEGDEHASKRSPACFRFPSGPLADTLKLVNGRPLFDAGSITADVLILRSQNDFWSRPEDVEALAAHLERASSVRIVELPHASHYVHLLADERQSFIEAVLSFTSVPPDVGQGDRPPAQPTSTR